MPELPEVENVRRRLEKVWVGHSIQQCSFLRKDIRGPLRNKWIAKIQNQTVKAIHRRAKFLLIELGEGTILSHLGMTGEWREIVGVEVMKHDHVVLKLENGSRYAFHDPRRFGIFEWISPKDLAKHKSLKNLGVEPLDQDTLTTDVFFKSTRKSTAPIKTFLMDQKRVVGIGNIYACEILFLAGVKPTRKAKTITQKEAEKIVRFTREVLNMAIDAGGSTIRDFGQVAGYAGDFQNLLSVYDRKGEPCKNCGKPIAHTTMASRSTYWCKTCQT